MTFNLTAALKYLQTDLGKTGYFSGGVVIGEPLAPPNDLAAAIFLLALEPSRTTLSDTIDVWTIMLRLYARAGMTPENAERVELALALAVSQLETYLAAAFTLGGTVRTIDWAGEEAGHRLSAKWGHLVLAGTIYRCVDLTVPLVVDSSATFAA